VKPTEWRVAGTANEMDVDWLAPTVLATFTNSADADAAFEAAVKQSELKDRIMLFGQSVFLSGPNASSNWTVRFKVRGAQVFLERPASNSTAIVNFNCQAPDDVTASAIQFDCDSYFSGLWLKIWPPWVSLEGLEPDRVKAIESIRYAWTQLNHIDRIMSEDPEYRRIPERIRFSSRRWTRYEIAKTAQAKFDAQQAIYRRELNRLANSDDRWLDKELVALYDRYWFATSTNRGAAFKGVQEHPTVRLGCLPFKADLPANAQAWRASKSGDLERKQLELNFRFLVFWRTDLGLPAMASYLQSKGCHHFRYEIRGSVERDEESVQSRNQ
jgi:hypothetical protein